MKCPVCKQQMIILELKQIEIDYCLVCEGIWLDAGELELIMEDKNETISFLNSFKVVNDLKEKKYKCPICDKKMEKILFSKKDKKELILDRCNNDGLWFDKGELMDVVKLIETSAQGKIIDILKEMFNDKINK